MWGEIDCPSCGGTGFEPGEDGYWHEGIYYSGRFPCGDCNGSGKQPVWFEVCHPCRGSGLIQGVSCQKCGGLGFHEPTPSPKISRWEEVDPDG